MKKLFVIFALMLILAACLAGGGAKGEPMLVYNDITAAENNTNEINRAIKNMKSGDTLVFNGGILYISVSDISGCINIKDKSNITIDGNGTTLVNTSFDAKKSTSLLAYQRSGVFDIARCENISIKNLAIDFYNYINASGIITDYKDGHTYLKLFDEYLTGDKPRLEGDIPAYASNSFSADGIPAAEESYFDEANKRLLCVNPETGEFKLKGNHGKIGDSICVRLTEGSASPTIFVRDTQTLNISDVTVRSSPSATFYALSGSSNFTFENFVIEPYENSEVIYASNVDCIHIKGLRGQLNIKNCRFIGIGDDALNVHSRAAMINRIDGNTVTAIDGYENSELDSLWANVGDTVELFDKNFKSLGYAVVKKFSNDKIELDKLPDGAEKAYVMQNLAYCPETVIENCTVERGRARGVLLQTKNATVTGCDFKNLRLSAVLVSPDIHYWYEMGPAENIIITGNTFTDCLTSGNKQLGVINVSAGHDNQDVLVRGQPHKNIKVNNNVFNNVTTYALNAMYVDGIEFTENILNNVKKSHRTVQCENKTIE